MAVKVNDVYRFRYNEEYCSSNFEPYWCFDGQLIVKQDKNGELYLQDTYWGWDDHENKRFALEQVLKNGTLEFICNLDNVEKCDRGDLNYYADEDIFNISYHHGHHKKYRKRKGAEKSAAKMEQVLKSKITAMQHEIEWSQKELGSLQEKLNKLQSGDIGIYI